MTFAEPSSGDQRGRPVVPQFGLSTQLWCYTAYLSSQAPSSLLRISCGLQCVQHPGHLCALRRRESIVAPRMTSAKLCSCSISAVSFYAASDYNEAGSLATVERARELGVTMLDTAEAYGGPTSENETWVGARDIPVYHSCSVPSAGFPVANEWTQCASVC